MRTIVKGLSRFNINLDRKKVFTQEQIRNLSKDILKNLNVRIDVEDDVKKLSEQSILNTKVLLKKHFKDLIKDFKISVRKLEGCNYIFILDIKEADKGRVEIGVILKSGSTGKKEEKDV